MIPSIANAVSQMTVHAVALASSSTSVGEDGVFPKIVEALDNSIRDLLQRTSNEFFAGVLISAFVVAIGVSLEAPEILHELWPRLFIVFTWTSDESLHRFERRIKKIAFAGWFLICVGVFGEGMFEGLQNRAEGQLQTFNAILLTDARLTASTAKHSAIEAADAAALANTSAGEAKGKADELARITSDLRTKLAAEVRAELEAKSREDKLEKSLAPRILSFDPNPTSSLSINTLSLQPYAHTHVVLEVLTDAEARRAADNVEKLVSGAGWIIDRVDPNPELYLQNFDGVTISDSSVETDFSQAGKASVALTMWLKCHGWKARLDGNPIQIPITKQPNNKSIASTSADSVRIAVGFKPDTFFVRDMFEYPISDLARNQKCPANP